MKTQSSSLPPPQRPCLLSHWEEADLVEKTTDPADNSQPCGRTLEPCSPPGSARKLRPEGRARLRATQQSRPEPSPLHTARCEIISLPLKCFSYQNIPDSPFCLSCPLRIKKKCPSSSPFFPSSPLQIHRHVDDSGSQDRQGGTLATPLCPGLTFLLHPESKVEREKENPALWPVGPLENYAPFLISPPPQLCQDEEQSGKKWCQGGTTRACQSQRDQEPGLQWSTAMTDNETIEILSVASVVEALIKPVPSSS